MTAAAGWDVVETSISELECSFDKFQSRYEDGGHKVKDVLAKLFPRKAKDAIESAEKTRDDEVKKLSSGLRSTAGELRKAVEKLMAKTLSHRDAPEALLQPALVGQKSDHAAVKSYVYTLSQARHLHKNYEAYLLQHAGALPNQFYDIRRFPISFPIQEPNNDCHHHFLQRMTLRGIQIGDEGAAAWSRLFTVDTFDISMNASIDHRFFHAIFKENDGGWRCILMFFEDDFSGCHVINEGGGTSRNAIEKAIKRSLGLSQPRAVASKLPPRSYKAHMDRSVAAARDGLTVFRGNDEFLANGALASFTYNSASFISIKHANATLMAAYFGKYDLVGCLLRVTTPVGLLEASDAGVTTLLQRRGNWYPTPAFTAATELCRAKFKQVSLARRALLDTGQARLHLLEKDFFFGCGFEERDADQLLQDGAGVAKGYADNLGVILTWLRGELRKEDTNRTSLGCSSARRLSIPSQVPKTPDKKSIAGNDVARYKQNASNDSRKLQLDAVARQVWKSKDSDNSDGMSPRLQPQQPQITEVEPNSSRDRNRKSHTDVLSVGSSAGRLRDISPGGDLSVGDGVDAPTTVDLPNSRSLGVHPWDRDVGRLNQHEDGLSLGPIKSLLDMPLVDPPWATANVTSVLVDNQKTPDLEMDLVSHPQTPQVDTKSRSASVDTSGRGPDVAGASSASLKATTERAKDVQKVWNTEPAGTLSVAVSGKSRRSGTEALDEHVQFIASLPGFRVPHGAYSLDEAKSRVGEYWRKHGGQIEMRDGTAEVAKFLDISRFPIDFPRTPVNDCHRWFLQTLTVRKWFLILEGSVEDMYNTAHLFGNLLHHTADERFFVEAFQVKDEEWDCVLLFYEGDFSTGKFFRHKGSNMADAGSRVLLDAVGHSFVPFSSKLASAQSDNLDPFQHPHLKEYSVATEDESLIIGSKHSDGLLSFPARVQHTISHKRFWCAEQAYLFYMAIFLGEYRTAINIFVAHDHPSLAAASDGVKRITEQQPSSWFPEPAFSVMLKICRAKFQSSPSSCMELLKSGRKRLHAASEDLFFGCGYDVGQERILEQNGIPSSFKDCMGIMLMFVRSEMANLLADFPGFASTKTKEQGAPSRVVGERARAARKRHQGPAEEEDVAAGMTLQVPTKRRSLEQGHYSGLEGDTVEPIRRLLTLMQASQDKLNLPRS